MSHLIVVGVVGMHLGIYRLPNSATSDVAFAFAWILFFFTKIGHHVLWCSWIFGFSQFLVGICWMYNQSVTRWEKWITFHTIFLNKGKNMKHLVAYQFCLNFLYQGEDVKHFVGLGSAQFAWAKGRILCNLCHIITFHTIFFSRGKKHEAFCGCCQTNQNALLELVSHFMWAAKQDWAVTGCLFGSLVPGKKMQIHFHLAHSLDISRFGWMDGWIPCENAKRILCPDSKIPHCKSGHAGHVEPISPLISLSVKMWPCPVAHDVIVSCCAHCDLIMLCTPQGREIIWASVYFSWQFSSLNFAIDQLAHMVIVFY